MAQQNGASSGAASRNHAAALDHVPELWAEILRRVPEADRLRNVPLTSRRFSEACRDPDIWRELHILRSFFGTRARWLSFQRWLAARASGLQTLVIGDPAGAAGDTAVWKRRTPRLLALLAASAPQLRSLEHWYPDSAPANHVSALPAELRRLSQLTSLSLGCGTAPVTTAQVDALVQALPSLQHLALTYDQEAALTDGFPASIATGCSLLRSLQINAEQFRPMWVMRLSNVWVVPPELGNLAELTSLRLSGLGRLSLPDSISRLSKLRELDIVANEAPALPPGLSACQQLTRLALERDYESPVLASLQSLRCLTVELASVFSFNREKDMYWTQLTALTELHLRGAGRFVHDFPAALGGMTSLRKLCIDRAILLKDLLAGPYLSRLESLRITGCVMYHVLPANLGAATRLVHLDLTGNNRTPQGGCPLLNPAGDCDLLRTISSLEAVVVQKPDDCTEAQWDAYTQMLSVLCTRPGRAPISITARPVLQQDAR